MTITGRSSTTDGEGAPKTYADAEAAAKKAFSNAHPKERLN
jgi:hypothetical protein